MAVHRNRLLICVVFILPITALLALLFKSFTYEKISNPRTETSLKYDYNLVPDKDKSNKRVINADTKFMVKSTDPSKLNTINEPLNEANITDEKKHLINVLHQFSIHNSGFRHLTDWPPMHWNLNENPSLADLWETPITKDMPNWEKFLYNISKYELYDDTPFIEDLLQDMATKKIIAVDLHPGGTQFKLIFLFEDGGRALFKPMRFPREIDRNKNVLYLGDYERHVSEIAAFHLDRILGFRRVPPVVGRKVNITGELLPLFSDDMYMVDTFYYTPDGNYCLAGICKVFCSELFSGFCGNPHMLEGSFAYYIPPFPVELLEQRVVESPWSRTYELNEKADWEEDPDYCKNVIVHYRPFNETRRLYDVIDCAIFDFLMGNDNRVHYDEFTVFGDDHTPTLIHFDNGQGFGFSDIDDGFILAPLAQCCIMRLSTFNKLYELYTGQRPLSELMRESLSKDPLNPILTDPHLKALDRRLEKVLTLVSHCVAASRPSAVFQDDVK